MERVNAFKIEKPIRTPIVRLQGVYSSASANKITGPSQEKPQMSYSLNIKVEEDDDEEEKGNKISQLDSQYLSIPQVRVGTPPVQSLRARSQSVPSIENNILMEYYSVKSINNKANEDLITLSSRHLSSHSPSELSQAPTLHHNKLHEESKKSLVVNINNIEKGHHSERESPNACASNLFNQNDKFEKSKWIWSTIDDNQSKSYRNQTQVAHLKLLSQRPPTPFETKGSRKSSVISLKEINDDIEEIQINSETKVNGKLSIEKSNRIPNMNKRFSINFPFIKKLNSHKDEKPGNSNAETIQFASDTDSHIFSKR